ncbi:hypothetical protein F5Y17DRAFT_454365 [Xylariaceae sp. FL0594]|nr:hypothetical protein F5Y17DRAFT_454365 [Xylariaceae sp. FL0594]
MPPKSRPSQSSSSKPAKRDWKTHESVYRLLAAFVASVGTDYKFQYQHIAKYMGNDTTVPSVEWQFRTVRNVAQELKEAVEAGRDPADVDVNGAQYTTRARMRGKKRKASSSSPEPDDNDDNSALTSTPNTGTDNNKKNNASASATNKNKNKNGVVKRIKLTSANRAGHVHVHDHNSNAETTARTSPSPGSVAAVPGQPARSSFAPATINSRLAGSAMTSDRRLSDSSNSINRDTGEDPDSRPSSSRSRTPLPTLESRSRHGSAAPSSSYRRYNSSRSSSSSGVIMTTTGPNLGPAGTTTTTTTTTSPKSTRRSGSTSTSYTAPTPPPPPLAAAASRARRRHLPPTFKAINDHYQSADEDEDEDMDMDLDDDLEDGEV